MDDSGILTGSPYVLVPDTDFPNHLPRGLKLARASRASASCSYTRFLRTRLHQSQRLNSRKRFRLVLVAYPLLLRGWTTTKVLGNCRARGLTRNNRLDSLPNSLPSTYRSARRNHLAGSTMQDITVFGARRACHAPVGADYPSLS